MGIFAVVCILICFLINPLFGIVIALVVIGCSIAPKKQTPKNEARDDIWED